MKTSLLKLYSFKSCSVSTPYKYHVMNGKGMETCDMQNSIFAVTPHYSYLVC